MALDSGEGSSIEAINAHMKDAYAALNNDDILKGKAQDYADTINSSHFVLKTKIFKHYNKNLKRCHQGMDEIGGDLITFGIVDNNPIFAVTGKAAHEYVKLLKRRNVDLRTSLIGIKNIIRIEDINSELPIPESAVESVVKRRKNVKNKLKKKYLFVFPEAETVPWKLLKLSDIIGWPDVDLSNSSRWGSEELQLIEKALSEIEFKRK